MTRTGNIKITRKSAARPDGVSYPGSQCIGVHQLVTLLARKACIQAITQLGPLENFDLCLLDVATTMHIYNACSQACKAWRNVTPEGDLAFILSLLCS